MLPRQIRVLIGFIVASLILVLLVHRQGYEFNRHSIMASLPGGDQKATNTEASPTTATSENQRDDEKPEQTQLVPGANPTDAPASDLNPPSKTDPDASLPYQGPIDWGRFAYVQYVTDPDYLCNAAMVFAALHDLGSRADRVMLYPDSMLHNPDLEESKDKIEQLLVKVQDAYNVNLVPVEIQHRDNPETTWADSYTKLLAFNQTQYDRIIAFDSDALLLQSMDELFFMPPCPVALPRAYWLMKEEPPKKILSTHMMLLQPSALEFARLQKVFRNAKDDEFDMEIVNKLYQDSAAVLPHRPYGLLTAEFRSKDHKMYLGSDAEQWDPRAILNETKLVHFSDWPVPKPWVDVDDTEGLRRQHQPECKKDNKGQEKSCPNRDVWNELYAEFRKRRINVCGSW